MADGRRRVSAAGFDGHVGPSTDSRRCAWRRIIDLAFIGIVMFVAQDERVGSPTQPGR